MTSAVFPNEVDPVLRTEGPTAMNLARDDVRSLASAAPMVMSGVQPV